LFATKDLNRSFSFAEPTLENSRVADTVRHFSTPHFCMSSPFTTKKCVPRFYFATQGEHRESTERAQREHRESTERAQGDHRESTERAQREHRENTERSQREHRESTESTERAQGEQHRESTGRAQRERRGSAERAQGEHRESTGRAQREHREATERAQRAQREHRESTEKAQREHRESTERAQGECRLLRLLWRLSPVPENIGGRKQSICRREPSHKSIKVCLGETWALSWILDRLSFF